MEMTNSEIARSYREAKRKKEQIGILADLNCTSKERIKEILKSEGIVLPGGSVPKAVKEAHKTEAPAEMPVKILTDPSAEKVAVEIKVEEPKAPQAVIEAAEMRLKVLDGKYGELEAQLTQIDREMAEIQGWLKEVS